ncbi:hypothetical protein [Leptospira kirschneri]|uniref:hypothetical protein n=1 Tax=Leptospira kirschneri TaxID=29507 RepID=UPI0012F63162|nr:hypothetical protein [Leptospira kirschneri]
MELLEGTRFQKKPLLLEVWSNAEGCEGCVHLDLAEAWCNLQGLPCAVNPILSFQHAIPGMACMGAGYDNGLLPGIDPIEEIDEGKTPDD